jgi:hypothetical protein
MTSTVNHWGGRLVQFTFSNEERLMPHFKIAHLREQGQNMIIVPLESSGGRARRFRGNVHQ